MAETDLVLTRRPSARSFLGWYLFLAVIAIACEAAAFTVLNDAARIAAAVGGVAVAALGSFLLYLVRICTLYRLFPEHLEVETGIISKKIENVKLFRVRDIGLSQSIMGRLLGFGNVTLTATDTSAPHLVIRGISDPREVYERIAEIVSKTSAQRRTMIVEDMETAEIEQHHQ